MGASAYFTTYIQTHINDLKNSWKGIKKQISLKRTWNSVPSTVTESDISLTKPEDITNAFNKFFWKFSSTVQSPIKFSRYKFYNFLPYIDINSFFIKPVDKIKIQIIVLPLNPVKAVGPNSVPTKIVKFIRNNISNQLPELFNLSLLLNAFPSILVNLFPSLKDNPNLNVKIIDLYLYFVT